MESEPGRSLKRAKNMNSTLDEFKDKLLDTINSEINPFQIWTRSSKYKEEHDINGVVDKVWTYVRYKTSFSPF